MMRHPAHSATGSTTRQHGFTLLEVLVAMTILTIIGAAIFTMFRQSSQMYSKTIAHTRQYVAAREALGLIANEIRQARLVPTTASAAAGGVGFWGYEHEVYFVAPTGMRDANSKQDLCVIGYWLSPDGANDPDVPDDLQRYCLTDQDANWKTLPEPSGQADLTNHSAKLGVLVRSLTFEYWDAAGDKWDAGPWGDPNTLPPAVRITLVVADPSDPVADDKVNHTGKKDKTFITVVDLDNAE